MKGGETMLEHHSLYVTADSGSNSCDGQCGPGGSPCDGDCDG